MNLHHHHKHHHKPGEAPIMPLRLLPGPGRYEGWQTGRLALIAAALPSAFLGLDSEARSQRGIQRMETAASSRWTGRPSTPRLWGSC